MKIIGSLFIIVSSSAIGFYYSNKSKYRINDLEEFKKTLIILKSEIEFSITSLPEAMISISNKANKKFEHFFKYIADRLNEKKGDGVNVIWEDALEVCFLKTYFEDEDIDYFRSLGSTLGHLDKKLQLNSIQIIVEYINSKVEILHTTNEKNKKMYSSLGTLGGILIAIILF